MTRLISRYSLAAAVLACGMSTAAETLSVTVDGSMAHPDARLSILLFTLPDGFPDKPAQAARRLMMDASHPTARFECLDPGYYALSVFQDLNGNGTCDTSWLGIPKEPYGMSGYEKPPRFFPRFSRARFMLQNSTNIIIRLLH